MAEAKRHAPWRANCTAATAYRLLSKGHSLPLLPILALLCTHEKYLYRLFTCCHRSRAPAVYPCHVPFMYVFAQFAWATKLAHYVYTETRAPGSLRVQYLNYRYESVSDLPVFMRMAMYVCCPPKWHPGNSCYMRVTEDENSLCCQGAILVGSKVEQTYIAIRIKTGSYSRTRSLDGRFTQFIPPEN